MVFDRFRTVETIHLRSDSSQLAEKLAKIRRAVSISGRICVMWTHGLGHDPPELLGLPVQPDGPDGIRLLESKPRTGASLS